jgi:hypothetical protein
MQPHPQHSPRNSDAWAEPDAKPKKRAKKAVAKKAAAQKKLAKTTKVKKVAKAKPAAKKKPRKSAAYSAPVAELVSRLEDKDVARQVITSLAVRHRLYDDELVHASMTAQLRRELDDSRRKLVELEQKLAELSGLVAELAAARLESGDTAEPIENPFNRWLGDPSIAKYFDQHIAMHPALGVVAHGNSPDAVIAQVRAKGIPLDEIVLDFISSAPF